MEIKMIFEQIGDYLHIEFKENGYHMIYECLGDYSELCRKPQGD